MVSARRYLNYDIQKVLLLFEEDVRSAENEASDVHVAEEIQVR